MAMRVEDIATQAFSAGATGLVVKFSPKVIQGQFTEIVTAAGIGIAGLFGVMQGRGLVEKVGMGAVDGAASYFGTKMADFIMTSTQTPPATAYPVGSYPKPRLVGYQAAANTAMPKTIEQPISKKSYMEI